MHCRKIMKSLTAAALMPVRIHDLFSPKGHKKYSFDHLEEKLYFSHFCGASWDLFLKVIIYLYLYVVKLSEHNAK